MKSKLLIGLLLLATVSLTSCWKGVPPRNVGIKVKTMGQNKGVEPVTLSVGKYWIGINWTLYTYPTNQTIYPFTATADEGSPTDESMKFQDKDGLPLSCDIAASAHVDPKLVTVAFQTYGGDMENIIKTYMKQDLLSGFINYASSYTSEQLYSVKKMEMLLFVQKIITDKFAPTGVVLDGLAYKSEIRLPEKVLQAINDKIEATQTALKTQAQIQQTTYEAQKVAAKAEGEYQAKLLEAKGNKALSESITPALTSYILANKWNGVSPIYSGSGSVLPPLFAGSLK
jgi:regulator of protease activity HflC (stomatin/prohibitin superfamily)